MTKKTKKGSGSGMPEHLRPPEVRRKADKSRSRVMALGGPIEPPETAQNPSDVESWWPFYLPSRDGRQYGHPRKIATAAEFDRLVDKYFEKTALLGIKPTMTGLMLSLGFHTQVQMTSYAKSLGLSKSVSRARALIKQAYEQQLTFGGISPKGPQFVLEQMARFENQEEVDAPDFEALARRVEMTGADGGPIDMRHVVAQVTGMSEVEKATRLFHILQEAIRKTPRGIPMQEHMAKAAARKTQVEDEDDEDDLLS